MYDHLSWVYVLVTICLDTIILFYYLYGTDVLEKEYDLLSIIITYIASYFVVYCIFCYFYEIVLWYKWAIDL